MSSGTGKNRVRRTVTDSTQAGAARKLRELKEQAAREDLTAGPNTIAQLAEHWWRTQRYTITDETQSRRRPRVEQHIINDPIGRLRLGELRTRHVEAWLARKVDAGYERSGVRHPYAYKYLALLRSDLHLLIEWAIHEEWLRSNAVSRAKIPMREPKPVIKRTLTPTQAARVRDVCRNTHRAHGNLVLVSLLTGLRPAEVAALTEKAIDWQAGTIHVSQAVKRESGGRAVSIGDTKTSAEQIIAVSDMVLDAIRREKAELARRRLAAGPNWCRDWDGLIFLTATGRPMWSSNLRRLVRSLFDDAGIDITDWTPYELRHTWASVSRDAGVPIHEIAAQLGHRDNRMVEQHYFHRTDPVVRNAGVIEGLNANEA